jgi:hypothetical protein
MGGHGLYGSLDHELFPIVSICCRAVSLSSTVNGGAQLLDILRYLN